MTEIDLIAVGPWILFGVVLAAVCFRLARSRRAVPHGGTPRATNRPSTATHRKRHAPRRTPPHDGDSPGPARDAPAVRAPYWRALLEARWRARLQEVTELSLAYHRAAAAVPDVPVAAGPHSTTPGQRELARLLRRTVAARRGTGRR